jgi:hypothetical protein
MQRIVGCQRPSGLLVSETQSRVKLGSGGGQSNVIGIVGIGEDWSAHPPLSSVSPAWQPQLMRFGVSEAGRDQKITPILLCKRDGAIEFIQISLTEL